MMCFCQGVVDVGAGSVPCDGWPIRAEARLYDRPAAMPVRIEYRPDTKPNAWRTDWPAVPRGQRAERAATGEPAPGGFTNVTRTIQQ